ncbi:MAG: DEAD/DEAH box helicase family protein, partial [Fimbriimonadaceae bacterium]|nr:DEAD/DEAH box helicase family protein [Fimbriimonadaceae bacterium]
MRLHPSPVLLRPYQARALAQLLACRDRGLSRVLAVMPTGTGKTTLFSALIGTHHEESHSPTLVLAHRRELLDQAYRRIGLQNHHLDVSIEGAGRSLRSDAQVVVGSIQSLGRPNSSRLPDFQPGLIIIDEAHHAAASTYQQAMKRFRCYEDGVFTVGVTATPHRMDNRQLHGSDQAIFQDVAFSYSLREAIQEGWLADVRGYRVATGIDLSKVRVQHGDYNARQLQDAVNTEERNEAAFMHWSEVARDRRT